MPSDPRQRRFALACRYLSGPEMAAADAVRDEVRALLKVLPAFPGIVAALAGANDLELLDAFENHHGAEAWKDFAFFQKDSVAALEEMKLSSEVLSRVYSRSMASRTAAVQSSYHLLLVLGAQFDSRPFLTSLLAAKAPDKDQIIKILSDARLIENSSFRKEASAHLGSLKNLELTRQEIQSLCITLSERGLPRSFALIAQAGLATQVPDTLIRSCPSKLIRRMNAELGSNHGQLNLMTSLPVPRDLLRASGKGLENSIFAVLPS